jgi:hypothetical protein
MAVEGAAHPARKRGPKPGSKQKRVALRRVEIEVLLETGSFSVLSDGTRNNLYTLWAWSARMHGPLRTPDTNATTAFDHVKHTYYLVRMRRLLDQVPYAEQEVVNARHKGEDEEWNRELVAAAEVQRIARKAADKITERRVKAARRLEELGYLEGRDWREVLQTPSRCTLRGRVYRLTVQGAKRFVELVNQMSADAFKQWHDELQSLRNSDIGGFGEGPIGEQYGDPFSRKHLFRPFVPTIKRNANKSWIFNSKPPRKSVPPDKPSNGLLKEAVRKEITEQEREIMRRLWQKRAEKLRNLSKRLQEFRGRCRAKTDIAS